MAGHLPIPITNEIGTILNEAFKLEIKNKTPFEKIRTDVGFYQLLTDEYKMDEEHGKEDDLIFSFTPKHLWFVYEFHINKDGFINEIYKVE